MYRRVLFLGLLCMILSVGFAEERIDLTSFVQLDVTTEKPIDRGIRAAAVDLTGNIAIMGRSSLAGGKNVIAVYKCSGEYWHGYELSLKYERGHGRLIFDSDGVLCHGVSYSSKEKSVQQAVIRYTPGSVQYESYAVSSIDETLVNNCVEFLGQIPISRPLSGNYRIDQCTESFLSVKNCATEEIIFTYDQNEPYGAHVKSDNRKIFMMLPVMIAFIILLGWFLSWCDENRRSAS